jgi:hypothetical protein
MICDLQNNQAPSNHICDDLECKLLYPMILAFKLKTKNWLNIVPHCHKWLFDLCVGISRSRGWDIHEIYQGVKPVELSASQESEDTLTFRLSVDGFQYSKMTFTMEN